MRKHASLLLVGLMQIAVAQNAIDGEQFLQLSAFEEFQERKYQHVISELGNSTDKSTEEEILFLLSKLKTGSGSLLLIEEWLDKNPAHSMTPLAYFHLGEYYFYQKDIAKSKKYFSEVDATDLTKKNRATYGFMYGVLQLDEENYQNAKELFQFARRYEFDDESKLSYYEAFANYHLGNHDEALSGFEKSKYLDEFGLSSKLFIATILLETGNIDEVISMTQSKLSNEKSIINSGFHQLVGKAYALKEDDVKAEVFFTKAIELHTGKPSAALYYNAGVAKFKIGDEDKAIEFLTNAGIRGGKYAQLSAFQLGRLYLKKKGYENALTAYVEASASDDYDLKEESYFFAATINAQLGFFTEAINYANDYLKYFDNSRKEEIQNLIAQSYLRTSNYNLALEYLNETGISNSTQQEVYQKVVFQKATQSFNDGQFDDAKKWFNKSLRFTPDQSLKDQSNYNLAEIAMKANNFDEAINYYNAQSFRDQFTQYGLGYAYYNKKQYANAISYFRSAVLSGDQNIKIDANIRLADCLYLTKSYAEALAIYTTLSRIVQSSYLIFQKALTQKAMGRDEDAIQSFKTLFTSTRYDVQACFQSAMIRFENAEFNEAEAYLTQIIENHENSSFVPQALLNRAIARKNLGSLESAREDYEEILTDFIDSEMALSAMLGLQELKHAGLAIKNLDKHIEQYRQTNPESGSLELIEFESAKQLYFDFSYDAATEIFEKYIRDYPVSQHSTEAKYYLAESYYRIDKLADAKPLFDELKYVRNSLTGRILTRLGEINKRMSLSEESEEVYKLLVEFNLTSKDTYNARKGLMQLYFANEKYNETIIVADRIIKAEWKPLNGELEALIVKARAWFQLGELKLSKTNYEKLAKGNDVYAAEANYTLGLILSRQGNYKKSLEILFELNSSFGSYTNWVDKSYFLIAKNYVEMGELFQAKATLRSIIQHSENVGIKNKSNALLNQIEQTDSLTIKDY